MFTFSALLSLLTLTLLEIVLGIDNVIFVSIIMGRMPKAQQKKARYFWMFGGIIIRIALLASLTWLIQHGNKVLFTLPLLDKGFTLRGLIMLGGGLFLLVTTVGEIHQTFSFDSVITAVGIANQVQIMIVAVVIAMFVMFLFSGRIAAFIDKHPTLKMLALSFLVLVGFVLLVEGWDSATAESMHLKNYVYFSMAFSFSVELLNMRLRKKSHPVELNEPDMDASMKNDTNA